MKVIIAGSRSILDFAIVRDAMHKAGFIRDDHAHGISEIVSGKADGVDTLGEEFAEYYNLPVTPFPALWADVNVPGAVIKVRWNGDKYNVLAGFTRNVKMAEYADCAVIVWDGKSGGSRHMISVMKNSKKPYFLVNLASGSTKWVGGTPINLVGNHG